VILGHRPTIRISKKFWSAPIHPPLFTGFGPTHGSSGRLEMQNHRSVILDNVLGLDWFLPQGCNHICERISDLQVLLWGSVVLAESWTDLPAKGYGIGTRFPFRVRATFWIEDIRVIYHVYLTRSLVICKRWLRTTEAYKSRFWLSSSLFCSHIEIINIKEIKVCTMSLTSAESYRSHRLMEVILSNTQVSEHFFLVKYIFIIHWTFFPDAKLEEAFSKLESGKKNC